MTGPSASSRQKQLWLAPEQGSVRRGPVADVALRLRSYRLYGYAVPEALRERIRPGVRVRAPFGRRDRLVEGWCIRVGERDWDHTRKQIVEVLDDEPLLTPALLELAVWIADYYFCPPERVVRAMVPAPIRRKRARRVRVARLTTEDRPERLTARQSALFDVLSGGDVPVRVALERAAVTRSTLQSLVRRGLVEVCACELRGPAEEIAETSAEPIVAGLEDRFALTEGQRTALATIRQAIASSHDPASVFLLFGVPGSGKTEVYARAIRSAVERGRQAIVLIPEIALTTQIVERFTRRFGRVAVLHSRVSDRVRTLALRRIAAGAVDVVIGTRTAVFAPCPRPGLIVVDEEQDASFKNLAAPYFNARDVAVKRGQIERAAVVLGSATPALESWYNATVRQRYHLLELPQRVPGARLPQVRLVPSGESPMQASARPSGALLQAIGATLERRRQVVLLHNRRGYAVVLRCGRCGLVVRCERCGAHLVYHRSENAMKCHRCGAKGEVPGQCLDATCRGRLERGAMGIQRVEEELHRLFPEARLQRLDSDAMRKREHYEAALARFAAKQADILLGTQMVAKGLDFPEVDLVGVLDADAALSIPDFRATERLFQLLTQVAGRAGRRDRESVAIIQAADPQLPVLQQAVRMDYSAFAAAELDLRKALGYPPYSRLVRIICLDRKASRARAAAQSVTDGLRELAGRIDARIRVDDAEPCAISRLRDMIRWHVRVRLPRVVWPRRLLLPAHRQRLLPHDIDRLTIDVDPQEML